MKSVLVFLFLTLIAVSSAQNFPFTCSQAVAFCGNSVFSPGTVGVAETGPDYGCLGDQPAPAWFVFEIASGNNITIDFTNTNNVDIDYAIWGPFTTPNCTALDTGAIAPASCSFSPNAQETAVLTNIAPGQFYIMVVTNFARVDTTVSVTVDFTTTNGDLDCSIVSSSPSLSLSSSSSTSPSPSASATDNLGELCTDADPFCGLSQFNPGTTGAAQAGPNYGCLSQQPAPAWFWFRIASGNNITIDFTNSNNVDIDYALWGPFASVDCATIESGLVAPTACSFSPNAVEEALLTTVNPGEIYVMVITNFAQVQTVITAQVSFATTNGDLDCTIVPGSASTSFSPSTSLSSTISITPSNTPSTSFSPSTSLSTSITPTRSESNSVSPSRSVSSSQSETPSTSLTRSTSPTRTPSRTASPTASPSGTPRRSRSPTSSTTPTISESRTPTPTGTPSRSSRRSRSPTSSTTPTISDSRTPTPTPTPSRSSRRSRSPTSSTTPTISLTRSQTTTPTISRSSRRSRSPSPTSTPTISESGTPRASRSQTPTNSPTRSITRTPSPTRSITRTPSPTRSITRTPTSTPIQRTTGLRTTGVIIRTTGVVIRTTGQRTTGVIIRTTGQRTTGVIIRTTGSRTSGVIIRTTGSPTSGSRSTGVLVVPSSTPSISEIIIESSAAFSVSPLSLIFVSLVISFTLLIVA